MKRYILERIINPSSVAILMNPNVLTLFSLGLICGGYILYTNSLPLPEDVDEVSAALKGISKEYKNLNQSVRIALERPDLYNETDIESLLSVSSILEEKNKVLLLEKEARIGHNSRLESSKNWGLLAACGGATVVAVGWLMTYFWR